MAGCTISKGRAFFCGGQVGGIKKVFLANYYSGNRILGVTSSAVAGATYGYMSDISVDDSGTAIPFYEFDLDRQASSFNQTIVTGSGGAVVYQQDLELKLSHDSGESWDRMQNVVEGLWQIFVLDNNGMYYLLGTENGVQVTGGAYAHGGDVAYGDYVGYSLTLQGAEPKPAFVKDATPFGSAVFSSGELELSTSQYNHSQS